MGFPLQVPASTLDKGMIIVPCPRLSRIQVPDEFAK
jgi:hypothetical protein